MWFLHAEVMGEDPVFGMMLKCMEPGFEWEPYFNANGEQIMINMGPGGMNLGIRKIEDVRFFPLYRGAIDRTIQYCSI